eukprot:COSAG03_NODE_886_length_5486_cov_6.922591_6_plen_157_part_00
MALVGGFTEAMKVAGWCEAHYIDLMPHNPLGPVSTAACIHLGAAVPNFAYLVSSASRAPFVSNLVVFYGMCLNMAGIHIGFEFCFRRTTSVWTTVRMPSLSLSLSLSLRLLASLALSALLSVLTVHSQWDTKVFPKLLMRESTMVSQRDLLLPCYN